MEKEYAYIKNSQVINLVIFDDPSEELLNQFKLNNDLDFIILSDNKAYVGGVYDGLKFIPKKPFNSWTYSEELNEWQAPSPYPIEFYETESGEILKIEFKWDEENLEWYNPGLLK